MFKWIKEKINTEPVAVAVVADAAAESSTEEHLMPDLTALLEPGHAVKLSATLNFDPICEKHGESMVLGFYDRAGSAPGNDWVCRTCVAERQSQIDEPRAARAERSDWIPDWKQEDRTDLPPRSPEEIMRLLRFETPEKTAWRIVNDKIRFQNQQAGRLSRFPTGDAK